MSLGGYINNNDAILLEDVPLAKKSIYSCHNQKPVHENGIEQPTDWMQKPCGHLTPELDINCQGCYRRDLIKKKEMCDAAEAAEKEG